MAKKKSRLRVRRSLKALQDDYENGKKKPLETLMRAWKGIKELPPEDFNSFFMIGGYHGEPFRGAGWGNPSYWGGYCNHGNILFPTWHRMYLMRLEDALRSIPGCADVALAYWDETSEESLQGGIPWALTQETFELDGETIPNPLRSFVLNRGIVDHLMSDPVADYSKPQGYETVRYPLSGLVGTPEEIDETEKHNAQYPDYDENVTLLNQNVVSWLGSSIEVEGQTIQTNTAVKYQQCLDAPNFTVFSNTTSAAQWKDDTGTLITSIESPHNAIHLAVGGFDIGADDYSPIAGANGDMGENDTAGFDPLFYFHHCFVDLVFWQWQKKHKATNKLEIIPHYPGTNSVDVQGPTPGTTPNAWLTLESPLDPFRKKVGRKDRPCTSLDCINIEKQLGYTYGPGSLDTTAPTDRPSRMVTVRGINRAIIPGSFVISVFAQIDGKKRHIGTEGILSRWHVEGCANCQTHLEARASIPLPGALGQEADSLQFEVEVRTRNGLLGPTGSRPPFTVKVE